jgi:REP element-mobilizing transposase RayT
MARLARVVVPGVAHHVTQRGNRRQATFFQEDDWGNSGDTLPNLHELLAVYVMQATTPRASGLSRYLELQCLA